MNSGTSGQGPKVLVCQHGARHRYAIPRMLEEAGMLAALYTDSSRASFLGKISSFFGDLAPVSMQRLAGRRIKGVPTTKVFSSDRQYWQELAQQAVGRLPNGIYLYHQRHRVLSKAMIARGLQQANVVYSMYHENLDFIRWAKEQGAKSVVDVFISPETEAIMDAERVSFPDWNIDHRKEGGQQLNKQLWNDTTALADLLVCPSEFVAKGVRSVSPDVAHKIRIVPYGCSIDYQGRVNEPVKGRVLFAGGDALRKGLHYLAEAAAALKGEIPELDVRVAGALPECVVKHPQCKDLLFLGKLTSKQMKEEYLSADVFVMPSLAEGFAGVVAEAIGAGCPVIVTKEAGSPVVNEREGLIVPARDSRAIADSIFRIVSDRELRRKCASKCLAQADFYSEGQWKQRLIETIHPEAF